MPWFKVRIDGRPKLQNAIQERFEVIAGANGFPPAMLLIAESHSPIDVTIWKRLADQKHAPAFPEFEPTSDADLPQRAALLVGHNDEFEKLFEYRSWARSGPKSTTYSLVVQTPLATKSVAAAP